MFNFSTTSSPKVLRANLNKIERQKITFVSNGILTLGVEIEIQLIDPRNYNLKSCAPDILELTKDLERVKPEFYLSTIEINTDKCLDVKEIERDLQETIQDLNARTAKYDILFASTGTHPFSDYKEWHISPDERYVTLIDKTRWISQRMCVFGTHIHLGMENGEDYIAYHNFFSYFIPHFLALSASSPFWQGIDTGLASSRPSAYEALPTAGQSYTMSSWEEFENIYSALLKSNAIASPRDLWWDMRPSPKLGTLEIRICDGIATLSETVAITAFIHCLAHWFKDHRKEFNLNFNVPVWLYRENKWRAMRYGLETELIIDQSGTLKLLKEDLEEWIEYLKPYYEMLNYQIYLDSLKKIITLGNSASRQRIIFENTHIFEEVVKYNIKEFQLQNPLLKY